MQEATLYRHILKDALSITWKNKILWLLGFLAVFWGDVGAYRSFNHALDNVGPHLPEKVAEAGSWSFPFEALSFGGFASLMLVTLVIMMLSAGFIMLVTAGRGGLLYAIVKTQDKEKVKVRAMLSRGVQAFWPLLGIGIISRLDIPLYMFLLAPLATGDAHPVKIVLFVSVFIILTIASLMLSLLGVYASLLVMLEGLPLMRAIRGALKIFAKNWLVSLELALILYFITVVVGLAVLLSFFVMSIPFLFVGILLTLMKIQGAMWFVLIPAMVVYIAVLLLFGSAFVTFQYSAWTLLFLRLKTETAVSKVVRLTARFGSVLHRKID